MTTVENKANVILGVVGFLLVLGAIVMGIVLYSCGGLR